MEDFIRFVKEKLKPFYNSHGCKRFEIFMPTELQTRYFSYQVAQERNRYTEQLIFNDLEDFENLLKAAEKDPFGKEIAETYGKRFSVSSCTFAILTQKV